jgi:hypothetical protein
VFGNSRPIVFIKNAQGLSDSFLQTLPTHPNGMLDTLRVAERHFAGAYRHILDGSIFVFCSLSSMPRPSSWLWTPASMVDEVAKNRPIVGLFGWRPRRSRLKDLRHWCSTLTL